MTGFYDRLIFSKGIVRAEFFDIETDELLAYTPYVTDFEIKGSMNTGEISGGPGNALIMCIPDTTRLSFTARSADTGLSKLRLTVGAEAGGNAVHEVTKPITTDSTGKLTLTGTLTVPPGSAASAPICYVTSSTGSDRTTIQAASGTPKAVNNTTKIVDFTGLANTTYFVKYFMQSSGSSTFSIPALFAPKVVRAHFAINLYARDAVGGGNGDNGRSALQAAIVGCRHYYIPYYMFTAAYSDGASQTDTGSVDLSGMALTYEELDSQSGVKMSYGTVADEFFESSTSSVDGVFIIGEGNNLSLKVSGTHSLTVKYSVDGTLTNIADISELTFTSDKTGIATVSSAGLITAKAAGTCTVTVSVTNSTTGQSYSDLINVTVTA